MADYFDRRDITGVTAFTNVNALFEFQFEAGEQLIHNDSNGVLEVSWDGLNVHARLQASGPSKVVNWSDHLRKKVWVRVAAGSPGGVKVVEVYALTR